MADGRDLRAGRTRVYIASPAQLGDIFVELNFEVSKRTTTGKISTSRDVLDELAIKYELPRHHRTPRTRQAQRHLC